MDYLAEEQWYPPPQNCHDIDARRSEGPRTPPGPSEAPQATLKSTDPEALTRGQTSKDRLKESLSLQPLEGYNITPPNEFSPPQHPSNLCLVANMVILLAAAMLVPGRKGPKPAARPCGLMFVAAKRGWGATQARRTWRRRWQNELFEAKAGKRKPRRPGRKRETPPTANPPRPTATRKQLRWGHVALLIIVVLASQWRRPRRTPRGG